MPFPLSCICCSRAPYPQTHTLHTPTHAHLTPTCAHNPILATTTHLSLHPCPNSSSLSPLRQSSLLTLTQSSHTANRLFPHHQLPLWVYMSMNFLACMHVVLLLQRFCSYAPPSGISFVPEPFVAVPKFPFLFHLIVSMFGFEERKGNTTLTTRPVLLPPLPSI